jgi:hypothetical protein
LKRRFLQGSTIPVCKNDVEHKIKTEGSKEEVIGKKSPPLMMMEDQIWVKVKVIR